MFAVIFEVDPRADRWDDDLGHASLLRPELLKINGFIANERHASRSRSGWPVSLSTWQDENALIRWRTHALHSEIQVKSRSAIFADHHLRVGEVAADTQEPDSRLARQHFDVTGTGDANFAVVAERPLETGRPAAAAGLLRSDTFDILTRPGDGSCLTLWADQPSAEAALSNLLGRRRLVRIIRQYGMFEREEAPQCDPPVCPVPTA